MIEGTTQSRFEPVREVFSSLWDEIEVGASLSVFVENELVINLWGGHTDRAQTNPWQQDTLVNSYSITKGIVSMAIACLVNEGRLEYGKPVADYWPQFGAAGKFDVTVAQALSHQAGVPTFHPTITTQDLYDWQKSAYNVASQAPAWEPGTAFGYHAITWGFIAGELIRQSTGMSAGEYLRSRISSPLDADFFIGLTEAEIKKCAEVIGPNHARVPLPPSSSRSKAALPTNDPPLTPYRHVCSTDYRTAQIPSSNGHGSSIGIAQCYRAALSSELFPKEVLTQATEEETSGEIDLCLGQQLRRARGFILNCKSCFMGPGHTSFGHAGTGGSTAFADPEHKVSFAYMTNQLHVSGTFRYRKLIDTFYNCLTR